MLEMDDDYYANMDLLLSNKEKYSHA